MRPAGPSILFINLSSFIDEPSAEAETQRDLALWNGKAQRRSQRVRLRSLDVALASITRSNQIFPG